MALKSAKSVGKKTSAEKPTTQKLTGKVVAKEMSNKKAPKKAAAKPTEKTKAQVVAKSSGKAKPTTTATQISPAERMKMIAEAAYYLAEARGFSQGNDINDWVVAEQQVNAKLKS